MNRHLLPILAIALAACLRPVGEYCEDDLDCASDTIAGGGGGTGGGTAGGSGGGCPANQTFPGGDACQGSLVCFYGSETCCGVTSPALQCSCVSNRFFCIYTDACYQPRCPDGGVDGGADGS